MKRIYRLLLWLYPSEFRTAFGTEMTETFLRAAEQRVGEGTSRFMGFAFFEVTGLLIGAAREWASKLTGHGSVRGRYSFEIEAMIGADAGFAAATDGASEEYVKHQIVEAEKRIEIIIRQMVHAIANHDFPKARYYSDQERAERESLRRLREAPGN